MRGEFVTSITVPEYLSLYFITYGSNIEIFIISGIVGHPFVPSLLLCYIGGVEKTVRPWGSFIVLFSDQNCQVKKLDVSPGQRLSLQSHKLRHEHWFVVKGAGKAQVDDAEIILHPGDSVDIPVGTKHRISNDSDDLLVFIEVQTGVSFDEEDIQRFEDDFGRV